MYFKFCIIWEEMMSSTSHNNSSMNVSLLTTIFIGAEYFSYTCNDTYIPLRFVWFVCAYHMLGTHTENYSAIKCQ